MLYQNWLITDSHAQINNNLRLCCRWPFNTCIIFASTCIANNQLFNGYLLLEKSQFAKSDFPILSFSQRLRINFQITRLKSCYIDMQSFIDGNRFLLVQLKNWFWKCVSGWCLLFVGWVWFYSYNKLSYSFIFVHLLLDLDDSLLVTFCLYSAFLRSFASADRVWVDLKKN